MLDNCGMLEFPYKGNSFSWVGKRRFCKVKCWFDRALGNEECQSRFPHTSVEYLKLWGSDHRPVLAMIRVDNQRRKNSFRFDKRWVGKPGFKDAVISGWGPFDGISRRDFHQKVANCRKSISIWKKSLPTNSEKMIEELKNQLDVAQDDENTTTEEIEEIRRKLCTTLREIYWQQKSRERWHKEGDKNTKFFHALTKQRRSRNRIISLKDNDGNLVENAKGIEWVASKYFQDLFTSSQPTDPENALQYITEKVTNTSNQLLLMDPSESEIKEALFDINPDKALGPDGMTSKFYQKFWLDFRHDIVKLVKDFFASGSFDPRLNQTNICLIPKKEKPRAMTEFRPISLCNVSYKIISKLLYKRLKKTLPNLISETQSAFMARRLITDNILLAQENFHALRTNSVCRENFMAIKTDMSNVITLAEIQHGAEIFRIIDTYGGASRQQLNLGKSSIMFGNRVDPLLKQGIKNAIGISSEGGMGMYLGLPEQICGSKKKVFSYVHDRLSNRVNNWSARLFSKGGKEIQIKSVAQAVPTYVMSCFLLLQGVTDKLRSAIANFWWSSKQNSSGIHWIAWDKICVPQDMGGLGFRDLQDFNLALLAKQLWRLIQYPSSLLARVLRGRYFNRSDPLEDRNVYSPSYGWRSIMAAKPFLRMGLRKTIGSGLNTRVWSEPWIPDLRA
ncbi:uncharacterized protein LOC112085439 [Eutrema salsugineum]|uniref:uncharacterized protein LOC112085439 n=1 Tax=Eutrema salsugineum TaxID=72664 RepID=UPI000CECF694|nr:uncharacterized protein LOC112085439 [Eutrema salsugineum]